MIGLFGIYRRDVQTPVDLAPLARRVRLGYSVYAPRDEGGAIGRAAHQSDSNCGILDDNELRIVTLGDIYDAGPLVPNVATDPAWLIRELYRADQLNRLADINGQFCAAVYDRKNHRLTLITDRHALYPLHVWRQGGDVTFGSLIYVLLGDERVSRKANPEALAQLFTMQRTVGRITSIAGIDALPAACIWQCDSDGVRERIYWNLTWREGRWNEHECAAALDIAFHRAVERQIKDAQGLLLSGGIDSRWILAATPAHALSSWTTASYAGNPELKLAERVADICQSEHHTVIVDPEDTLTTHDDAAVESNGLYPASPQFSAFMSRVGKDCGTVLSGHGLDYTLRGYYLPARFLDLAGSHTRLPVLRSIGSRPTGRDVFHNLRQGPPARTVKRIIVKSWQERWWRAQEEKMAQILAPWLNSEQPYNAWDAFILHAVSKHYAFTGMMSVRAACNLRIPAFDKEVMDVYLQMPPRWRCSGRVVLRALQRASLPLARLPNANTGFPADSEPWLDVARLIGRGFFRRAGLMRRPAIPSNLHSAGSWQNAAALYREGPLHRARFLEIRERLDGISFGMFDCDGLRDVIDEHLSGQAEHTKLMRQLLTHDAWVRRFGIEDYA